MSYRCPRCQGYKQVLQQDAAGKWNWVDCPLCSGRGWITEEEQKAIDQIIDMATGFASKAEAKLADYVERMGESWESRKS